MSDTETFAPAIKIPTGAVSGLHAEVPWPKLLIVTAVTTCSIHANAAVAGNEELANRIPAFVGEPEPWVQLRHIVTSAAGDESEQACAALLLNEQGPDAIACMHELIDEARAAFGAATDKMRLRIVDAPDGESEGPDAVLEITTQRSFDEAYAALDELRTRFWIPNWRRAKRLRIALRLE